MNELKWEAGQKVVVVLRGEVQRVVHIRRVLKRFVETDDGCKWDLSGYMYPKQQTYMGMRIELYNQKHKQAATRRECLVKTRKLFSCLEKKNITEAKELAENIQAMLASLDSIKGDSDAY